MNFENLYTIKTKLQNIYNKLELITNNKYNSEEIKKCFDAINTYLENYENIPNSLSNGNVQVKKEDKTISNMLKITLSLEEHVDKVYTYFRLFDDIKIIKKAYTNNIPNIEEVKKLSGIILNDLIDYKKLLDMGNFEEDRFNNEIVPTLYL